MFGKWRREKWSVFCAQYSFLLKFYGFEEKWANEPTISLTLADEFELSYIALNWLT